MRALVIVLLAAQVGCGPSRGETLSRIKKHDDNLRARASFDMACARDSLVIEPLEQRSAAFHDDVKYTVVAGVTGCDKRATYIYDEARSVWVLNTESRQSTSTGAGVE